MDIAAIIIFNTPFTTTTTNKYIVIHIDLNVRDEGADESQEQQMKYVPGRGLRVVLNKAVVAAANTIDKIKLTEDKTQAMRSAQKVTSILRSSDREKRYKNKIFDAVISIKLTLRIISEALALCWFSCSMTPESEFISDIIWQL